MWNFTRVTPDITWNIWIFTVKVANKIDFTFLVCDFLGQWKYVLALLREPLQINLAPSRPTCEGGQHKVFHSFDSSS